MVVGWIARKGSGHRVGGTKGNESLAGKTTDPALESTAARQAGRSFEDDFVPIGVGVAAVDESFTPGARRQLPVRDGESFQVDRGSGTEPPTQADGCGDHRLDQLEGGSDPGFGSWINPVDQADGLGRHGHPSLGPPVRGPGPCQACPKEPDRGHRPNHGLHASRDRTFFTISDDCLVHPGSADLSDPGHQSALDRVLRLPVDPRAGGKKLQIPLEDDAVVTGRGVEWLYPVNQRILVIK